MEISVRGWGRNMGTSSLVDQSLSDIEVSDGTAFPGAPPVIYLGGRSVRIGWHQKLKQTGDYRMDLELSHWDIIKLFKTAFGTEITPALMNRFGLKLSPELEKANLANVKLGDLTLAELAAMMKPAEAEKKADR